MPDQNEKNRKLNAELSRALMNDVERLELGFATYGRQIAAVAVIAAIVVALIFWGFSYSRRSAREAAFTLADASTVTELTAALDKYGDKPGAAAARFRLAKLRIDAKEYAAALEDLRTLIASAPAEPLLGNARLAEAYLLEIMDKPETAAGLFAELGRSMDLSSTLRAEANFNAGRLFIKLKKFDDAAAALNRAVNPDRQSAAAWCSMAHSLLLALESGDFGPYKPAAKL